MKYLLLLLLCGCSVKRTNYIPITSARVKSTPINLQWDYDNSTNIVFVISGSADLTDWNVIEVISATNTCYNLTTTNVQYFLKVGASPR